MKKNYVQEIEEMHISENGKMLLKNILHIVSKHDVKLKQSIPSIHLIECPHTDAELFTRVYADILVENEVFPKRSRNRYIKMKYPQNISEAEKRVFFQTIINSAVTCNKYYGVILLDIMEWNSQDVMVEKFCELLEYVEENKENIRVVIQSNANCYQSNIIKLFQRYINIVEVNPINFDEKVMLDYLSECQRVKGVFLNTETKQIVVSYLLELYSSNLFKGYSTVDDLIERMVYQNGKKGINKITEEDLMNIMPVKIRKNQEKRIGFGR